MRRGVSQPVSATRRSPPAPGSRAISPCHSPRGSDGATLSGGRLSNGSAESAAASGEAGAAAASHSPSSVAGGAKSSSAPRVALRGGPNSVVSPCRIDDRRIAHGGAHLVLADARERAVGAPRAGRHAVVGARRQRRHAAQRRDRLARVEVGCRRRRRPPPPRATRPRRARACRCAARRHPRRGTTRAQHGGALGARRDTAQRHGLFGERAERRHRLRGARAGRRGAARVWPAGAPAPPATTVSRAVDRVAGEDAARRIDRREREVGRDGAAHDDARASRAAATRARRHPRAHRR